MASLAIAAIVWIPSLRFAFAPLPATPTAAKLAAHQSDLFANRLARGSEAELMRQTNAEWDFMGRTFYVYALAELALHDPASRTVNVARMDAIIDDTMAMERERGLFYFLMPYAKSRAWIDQPARSQFTDGEIALMLGLRRMLADRADYRAEHRARVAIMIERMKRSPVRSAESYPNECWTFCNTVALAAIKTEDVVDGDDHSAFFKEWVDVAKARLVDAKTGLLASSYTVDGRTLDGPEGSSIWVDSHMLRVIDPEFAADQYRRAKKELFRQVLGFGYAVEWPTGQRGATDVDSGPLVPGLDVSPGSSGLAFIAAGSFGDRAALKALQTTLAFAAFPSEKNGRLRHLASNQVGDAVVLYGLSIGPMWEALAASRRP